ncbi:MAG: thiamine pyrophosphate-dependent enzyme [Chloroflexota bacterium]|nr:thiamine pyrophosphate-dependent enzyme [Chloroflexota bacterium]
MSNRMTADSAINVLSRRRDDQVVVSTMTIMAPWTAKGANERDLRCVGFMGGSSTLGLGVALARPDTTVWILDGDGSLAMQLGSLLTISNSAPENFVHIVFNNGVYDTSGAQPTLAAKNMSFADLAKSAGYPHTYTFDNAETFDSEFDDILKQNGPILIELMTEPIGKGYVPPKHSDEPETPALAKNWPIVQESLLAGE